MHSKGGYKICICPVILEEVNFFSKLKELIITSPKILDVI